MRFSAFILTVVLFASCSQSPDSENVSGAYRYSNNVFPWEIDIAEGWTMIRTIYAEEGADSLKVLAENKEADDVTASFQKDEYNMLQFTIEPFVEDFENEWLMNNAAVKQLLVDFYVQEGVKIDTTISVIENIGGLDFKVFSAKLFNAKDSLILNQEFYSTLLDDQDFSVCLTFNNLKDEHELKRMWRSSTFK